MLTLKWNVEEKDSRKIPWHYDEIPWHYDEIPWHYDEIPWHYDEIPWHYDEIPWHYDEIPIMIINGFVIHYTLSVVCFPSSQPSSRDLGLSQI